MIRRKLCSDVKDTRGKVGNCIYSGWSKKRGFLENSSIVN